MSQGHVFNVNELSNKRANRFEIRPDAARLAEIVQELDLVNLRKLSFAGEIVSEGRSDWRLDAKLGATVTQPCVVTLDPVTTRIEQKVLRRFLAELPAGSDPEEVEMPEDDTIEPLGRSIDVETIMIEALSLALPLYPRAQGAELKNAVYTRPGEAPLTDEAARPFAGLSGLRESLEAAQGRPDATEGEKSGDIPGSAKQRKDN